MYKLTYGSLLPVLAVCLFSISVSFAQDTPPSTMYAEVVYMKSSPGSDIAMVEGEVWGPIHKELVKAGHEYGWNIYDVIFPAEMNSPYDYIAINYYTSMDQMDWPDDAMEKAFNAAHPGKDINEMAELTTRSRNMVHRELYRQVNSANDGKGGGLGKVLTLNRMKLKPGQYDAYLEMENKVAKPVHENSIEKGIIHGWSLWERVFPFGESLMDGQFVTAEEWTSMGAMEKMDWQATIQEVHPGKSMDEVSEMISSTRTIERGEVWIRTQTVMTGTN